LGKAGVDQPKPPVLAEDGGVQAHGTMGDLEPVKGGERRQ
jgi:hypothetical protein